LITGRKCPLATTKKYVSTGLTTKKNPTTIPLATQRKLANPLEN
jgi:hypothetical protein